MSAPNPYNYNLPVEENMFFGRKQDLISLTENITASPGDSCALIGGRRMGKTSLLEACQRELDRQREETITLYLPIFLDFTGECIHSVQSFFYEVSAQTQAFLAINWNIQIESLRLENDQPPAPVMEQLLPRWAQAVMSKLGRPFRLILLLDECEQIVESSWAKDLYDALRHLLVSRRTRSLLKIVMAGAHRFLSLVRQKGSPLKNILKYQTLYIFNEDDAQALIREPTMGNISDQIVTAVMKEAGGHPFLIQYLMHEVWSFGISCTTPEVVYHLAEEFSRKRTDFCDWLDGLGKSSFTIYKAASVTNEPLSEKELNKSVNEPLPDFIQAAEALCYHGILIRENIGKYRITSQMFKNWFIARGCIQFETKQKAPDSSQPKPTPIIQQTIVEGTYVDQRGQTVDGSQTTIGKDVNGSLLSGEFQSQVSINKDTDEK